jgi:hypothetical protein
VLDRAAPPLLDLDFFRGLRDDVVLELELLVVVLETPAAPPPLLLPTDELLVFFGPGLVALGVDLAGWIEVVVGTPPPPQALIRSALLTSAAPRRLGLRVGIIGLYHGLPRLGVGLTRISPRLHEASPRQKPLVAFLGCLVVPAAPSKKALHVSNRSPRGNRPLPPFT